MQPLETQTPTAQTERTAFDYTALDAETRIVLQQKTGEIRAWMGHAAHKVVEIGEHLIVVQQLLAHGQWEAWLRSEFAWSDQTARRYMHVARTFGGKHPTAAFAPSALYALAAPSTPEAARMEACERAEAGEAISHTLARQIIAQHQPEPVAGGQSGDGTAHEVAGGGVQKQQFVAFARDENLAPGMPEATREMIDTQHSTIQGLAAQPRTHTTADAGAAPQMRQAVKQNRTPGLPEAALGWRLDQQGAADVDAARRSLAQDHTPPRPCEDCGGRATNRRLIGGVLAWRCDACAQLDAQMDALGLGGDGSATAAWTHWVALGRILAREDAYLYAVQLLRTLAPFIAQVRPGNRRELRAAIARLHACEAGSEAAHWLAVGWMLLDVEPPDAAGEIGA